MIKTLDEALHKIVKCTDGETRILTYYNDELGFYSVPIPGNMWMPLSGTYIKICQKLFIGGTIEEETHDSLQTKQ